MKEKIVLFTANTGGGIIQFVVQLYHTLSEMNYSVKVCCPAAARNTSIREVEPKDLLIYDKVKKVMDKRPYRVLASKIENESPDYIWYCDDSVVCAEVGLHLKDSNIRQLLTVHDAGGYHPTNRINLRTHLLRAYVSLLNKRFYNRIYKFVLLSPESEKTFKTNYPFASDNVVAMNLGAHIPHEKETVPPEMESLNGGRFLLFFGRIDKYKGIEYLLRAYLKSEDAALPLVIAGSGVLSVEEAELCHKASKVILINRFVGDGEMKWLFANSEVVLLPYIEATQSGVIPIAYYYRKPVVVSDLPGLTQFVDDGKTGSVCKLETDWENAIIHYSRCIPEDMSSDILQYYEKHMNWKRNIERMFSEI